MRATGCGSRKSAILDESKNRSADHLRVQAFLGGLQLEESER